MDTRSSTRLLDGIILKCPSLTLKWTHRCAICLRLHLLVGWVPLAGWMGATCWLDGCHLLVGWVPLAGWMGVTCWLDGCHLLVGWVPLAGWMGATCWLPCTWDSQGGSEWRGGLVQEACLFHVVHGLCMRRRLLHARGQWVGATCQVAPTTWKGEVHGSKPLNAQPFLLLYPSCTFLGVAEAAGLPQGTAKCLKASRRAHVKGCLRRLTMPIERDAPLCWLVGLPCSLSLL